MPRPNSRKPARAKVSAAEQLLSEEWDARQRAKELEPHTRRTFAAQMAKAYEDLEPPDLPTELHDRVQGCLVFWGVIAESPPAHSEQVSDAGPGSFEVRGIDQESGYETRLVIAADSPDEARGKAELRGIVVASVVRV